MEHSLKRNEAQSARAESTHKGVNWRSIYITQFIQQQRPEPPTVTLTWHACKYKVHKLHQRYILKKSKRSLDKIHAHGAPSMEVSLIDWWSIIAWLMIAYIALFSALLSRLIALACGSTWVTSFIARFCFVFVFEYPPKWCTYNAGMAGATWNCSRLGASPVYTIQPCSMSLHAKPHT